MKIKKVEIQAFRAYDKVEDGTFDFRMINTDECADFVSLYAPNGFGKTSFYDAVEYAYTHNIERLTKNSKSILSSDKKIRQNKEEGHYILRNKNSDKKLKSFIRIDTTSTDEPIERIIKKPSKSSSDFSPNKGKDSDIENGYFREVILSQDWISGFLKEDTPEKRYEKFNEYFGNKEFDNYRKKLIELINQNEKDIQEINEKLKGILSKLDFEGDTAILTKINEKIRELNSEKKIFSELDIYTSEKEIFKLENTLTERFSFIKAEIEKKEKSISELDLLLYGNEENINIKQFNDFIKELAFLNEKKEKLESLKKQFAELKKTTITLENIEKLILGQQNTENERKDILKLSEKYTNDINFIKNKEKSIKDFSYKKETLKKDIDSQNQKKKKLEVLLNSVSKDIKQISETIEKLPDIKKNLKYINVIRTEIGDKISVEKKNLETLLTQEKSLKSDIDYFKNILKEVDENIFPNTFDKEMESYIYILNEIERISNTIKDSQNKKETFEKGISKHDSFRKDLKSFVSKGLTIITEQNTDTCPLCSQKYESYSMLADKITNNPFLSEQTNNLLNQKKDIENSIFEYSEKLKECIDQFKTSISQEIADKEAKIKGLDQKIIEKQKFIGNKKKQNEVETKKYIEFQELILNKLPEDYEVWGKIELFKLKKEKENNENEINKVRNDIKKKKDEIEICNKNIELLKEELEKQDKSSILLVERLFSLYYPNKNIDFRYIEEDLQKISKQISTYNEQKNSLSNEIKSLKENLLSFNEDNIDDENIILTNKINTISISIERFKEVAQKYIINENYFSEEAFQQLKKEKEGEKLNLLEENTRLELLSELKKNVLPFLEYDKAKKGEKNLQKEKKLKEKVKNKLEKERNKVSKYLENQISSFFYEDLINDLYKRIDPHPEYKEIKFVSDFSSSKPVLNVSVKAKEGGKIIPNLYFSQAQLNILSLCIFLAKALNAKDNKENPIDCIFIDDPIQSMDSINILSTIDLLRGIVVNEKKQIILSTHDENFHNLLKKKIPSKLFKSKFLELETFGKVRQSIQ